MQETWIAALKNPPDPARPARPWLASVVRRLAGRQLRSDSRRANVDTEGAKDEALPETADLIERIDTEKRLASELQRLDRVAPRAAAQIQYAHVARRLNLRYRAL